MAKAKPDPKVFCFDLDGTLCTNTEGDYTHAKPYRRRIAQVNALYKAGHRVVIYTARGSKTGIDWNEFTRKQLIRWKVRFHTLLLGKPYADIYIDDKGISVADWFKDTEIKVSKAREV